MRTRLTVSLEMTVECPYQGAKLVQIGGFGSHLDREITSEVHKQGGWMDPAGKSFGLTRDIAYPISLLKLPFEL